MSDLTSLLFSKNEKSSETRCIQSLVTKCCKLKKISREKFFFNSRSNRYSNKKIFSPSTHPLHPILSGNAHHSCITAAAGTCIGHGFYCNSRIYAYYRTDFTTTVVFDPLHQFARSSFRYLPKIPHCCRWLGGSHT